MPLTTAETSGSRKMLELIKRFAGDTGAATSVEYAVIGGLISIAVIAGATLVGGQLNTSFSNLATALQ